MARDLRLHLPAGRDRGRSAGRLLLDEDPHHSLFENGRRYLQRADAVPVDPVALPLELGAQGRHASVDNALSRAAHFGLERPAAIQAMREVAREVAGWRERFAADGVNEATLERLRHSFSGRFIEQTAKL